MADIDLKAVASDIAAVLSQELGSGADKVQSYARSEGEKLAVSLAQIGELRAKNVINDEEMRLHLNIQKNATRAILMAIQGISIIAAERAINAALKVVAGALNTALGVDLLPTQ